MTTLIGFTVFGAALWLFHENGWFSGNSPGLMEAMAEHPWLTYIPNLSASLQAFTAEMLSAVFALTFSFVANKHFVFKSKSWKVRVVSRELTGFLSSRLLSLFIETALVLFLVSVLSANIILAKLVTMGLIIVLNYVLSKAFIFKKAAV